MVKAKFIAFVLFMGLVGTCSMRAIEGPTLSASQPTQAQQAWLREFDNICSKTQDAMTLAPEELAVLLERCDALVPQLEKLDDTRKKVYMGRLRMCRGLYAYVLDSKKSEKK